MNRGSTWPQQVLNLPVDAARNVFEFAYHPAAYIHPERAQQEVPEWLHGAGLNTRHASEGLLATWVDVLGLQVNPASAQSLRTLLWTLSGLLLAALAGVAYLVWASFLRQQRRAAAPQGDGSIS